MINQIEGYLLIPHELLHVLGYRLVGKRCIYHWGDRRVKPVDLMNRDERLVGLLFPFVVCIIAWFVLLPLPVVAYFYGGLSWMLVFSAISAGIFVYAFASIGDLRQAYLLFYDKKPHDKTPFDFFFWPILAKDKKTLQTVVFSVLACLVVMLIVSAYLLWPIY